MLLEGAKSYPMTNYFAAITPPDPIREELSQILHGVEGAKWREPENFHITLGFFGALSAGQALDLEVALGRLAAVSFPVQLRGTGSFSGGPHVRSLWVGVEESAGLVDLHRQVTQAAKATDIQLEARKFTPHLTLAYLNRNANVADIAQYKQTHPLLNLPSFDASCFSLFSSQNSAKRSVYVEEATYMLNRTV